MEIEVGDASPESFFSTAAVASFFVAFLSN